MYSHPSSERRITLRLLRYWEKLRDGRSMPAESDIKPDDLGDLWDSCIIIRVRDMEQSDYSFSHIGHELTESYLMGLPEESGIISGNPQHLKASYMQVIKTAKPLIDEGQFAFLDGNIIKYRQCLLPLGENGRVNAILGGMHFKVFSS